MPFEIYLQLLSALGFLISLYFVLVYHGFTQVSNKLIPVNICSENTCNSVLETKFSKVFKFPNFYFGLVYYLVIFISTFFVLEGIVYTGFLIVSWFVVLFSAYLAYALIFKLKTNCNLCFTAQIVNLVIAVLLSI